MLWQKISPQTKQEHFLFVLLIEVVLKFRKDKQISLDGPREMVLYRLEKETLRIDSDVEMDLDQAGIGP